jgi:hypothetical protein
MSATVIDRFIAFFNPAWALRRLRARQALAHTVVVASKPRPKPASQWSPAPQPQVIDDRLVRCGQASWIPQRPPREQNPWVRWEPNVQQPLTAMSGRQFPGR